MGFSHYRRKGYPVKTVAEALRAEAARYKLSVGWEVKTEIPVYRTLYRDEVRTLRMFDHTGVVSRYSDLPVLLLFD